jgi:hypothetical protein
VTVLYSHDSLTPNNFEIIRNGAQQQRDVILGIELPIKDDGNKRDFINSRVVGRKEKESEFCLFLWSAVPSGGD